jgi:hypothetical protein
MHPFTLRTAYLEALAALSRASHGIPQATPAFRDAGAHCSAAAPDAMARRAGLSRSNKQVVFMVKTVDTHQLSFLGGVFLTCICGLMLQIVETRALSVMANYTLAFFAIGVAMLGMTVGALVVFYRFEATYSPTRLSGAMARVMSYFAWSVLGSFGALLNLAVKPTFELTLGFVASWTLTLLVLLPPYVLLGVAVSLALTRSSQRISLVYGADLIGASSGCLVTLALLTVIDTYDAILVVGAIGAIAASTFSAAGGVGGVATQAAEPKSAPNFLIRPRLALGVLVLVAGVNALLGTHGLRPTLHKGRIEPSYRLTEERWNSFSRIAMTMRPQSDAFLFSASEIAPHVQLDQGLMSIDAEADTSMYRFSGDPREVDFLRFDATSLAYYIRHQGRSAVIGIGGGRDLLTASIFGFRDITGVEYNPIFVRLFAHDYSDFSGAGKIPGLRLIVDDARSWFARSHEQFDLIQMSMIDSWAGTTAGAFTISANPLYTVNGWKRFVSRLTPNGVFTVSRWYHPEHLDEAARVLSLAMATLMEMGEPKPAEHLYLAANGRLSTLIVGRASLSMRDLSTLDETVHRLHYKTLAAPNRVPADPVLERILHAGTVDELIRIGGETPLNLAPTWDANPFFFNQLRLPDPGAPASRLHAALRESGVLHGNLSASLTLLTLLTISMVVVVILIIGPAMSSTRRSSAHLTLWSSAYFLLIGVAFMFVEISLIQRMSLFLGHPIYSLAIVLFSVILASGVGSLLSDRAVPLSVSSLVGWPLVLAGYLALLPLWWGKLLDETETGSLIERASVCLVTVVPAGVLMGFMFPTGMRLCTRIDSRITPWLWALNGAGGVLASGAVVLVSVGTSLNHSVWVGAVAYALLAIVGPRLFKLEQASEDNLNSSIAAR